MKRLLTLPVLFLLGACSHHLYVQERHEQQYIVSNSTVGDTSLSHMLRPYKRGVDTQMLVIIGHTDIPLTKAQPESTLGNFMADATLAAARALDAHVDGAVGNYGGIRLPFIEAGPITKGKIFELMPFDNMLTIAEMPGDVVQQLCNKMASAKGWPVSGITFSIKDGAAQNVMIGGQPLDEHRMYKLALNDYIARGGDNCDFLVPLKKRFTTIFIRDALLAYVAMLEAQGKPLHPLLEKRIQYAE